jgi:hypothetical protein
MKIKIENFTATIDVQDVIVNSVNDNVQEKKASVDVLINGKYGANLNGFTYTKSWEDSDILAWVNVELEKYQI